MDVSLHDSEFSFKGFVGDGWGGGHRVQRRYRLAGMLPRPKWLKTRRGTSRSTSVYRSGADLSAKKCTDSDPDVGKTELGGWAQFDQELLLDIGTVVSAADALAEWAEKQFRGFD